MIVVRAPYRVSFFGGGTDYPAWYEKHGGATIAATLDRYCYVSIRRSPFLGARYRVVWSKIELVNEIAAIEHNAVRGCLQFLPPDGDGIEIVYAGDLPARAGLGSSSAFTVAMLRALHALRGEHVLPKQLADEAITVEQKILRETVGIQDQIASAFGGLRYTTIARDGHYTVEPLTVTGVALEAFSEALLMFYTGVQRNASEVAAAQVAGFESHSEELHGIAKLVPRAVAALSACRFDDFGALLHETWEFKRSLSGRISLPEIDDAYARAMVAGALGGKLLGAGGGGFLLFYVRGSRQQAVRQALSDLVEIPVCLGREGARVLVCEP